MKSISKAIAGGLGAAIAKVITAFIPNMDESTKQALEYVIYTIITALAVYIAPANK